MPNTDRTTVLAQALQAIVAANKDSLGILDVLYGNHNNIPRTPSVIIVPGTKKRELRGVAAPGGRVFNTMTVYVDIRFSKVGSEEAVRLELDQTAENIEHLIHQDTTVGGLLIHGFFTDWNPGEVFSQGGEFRSVRMTFVGGSETYLSA